MNQQKKEKELNQHLRVKFAMIIAGLTQKKVAEELGCSGVFVHDVVTGKKYSEKVQKCIARHLNIPREKLFDRTYKLR